MQHALSCLELSQAEQQGVAGHSTPQLRLKKLQHLLSRPPGLRPAQRRPRRSRQTRHRTLHKWGWIAVKLSAEWTEGRELTRTALTRQSQGRHRQTGRRGRESGWLHGPLCWVPAPCWWPAQPMHFATQLDVAQLDGSKHVDSMQGATGKRCQTPARMTYCCLWPHSQSQAGAEQHLVGSEPGRCRRTGGHGARRPWLV